MTEKWRMWRGGGREEVATPERRLDFWISLWTKDFSNKCYPVILQHSHLGILSAKIPLFHDLVFDCRMIRRVGEIFEGSFPLLDQLLNSLQSPLQLVLFR